jgi:hypothetical protein
MITRDQPEIARHVVVKLFTEHVLVRKSVENEGEQLIRFLASLVLLEYLTNSTRWESNDFRAIIKALTGESTGTASALATDEIGP